MNHCVLSDLFYSDLTEMKILFLQLHLCTLTFNHRHLSSADIAKV